MSSSASAALFVSVSTSPFISWSTGSILKSLHTIFSISASKSRSSLCLSDEASSSAHHGVIFIENTISTRTSRRGVAYLPVLSQMNDVFEFSLI